MLEEFNSLSSLVEYFDTEEKAVQYFEKIRWENDVTCPPCKNTKCYFIKTQKRYKCSSCKKQFNYKTGTIFQDSKISMRDWFIAIYIIINSKKGISSCGLATKIGKTQKTAYYMMTKLRTVLDIDNEITSEKFKLNKEKNV